VTTITTVTLSFAVTEANQKDILARIAAMLDTGAVFAVHATEPAPAAPAEPEPPKASRRSRKPAEPSTAPPAAETAEAAPDEEAPPVEEEPAAASAWDIPEAFEEPAKPDALTMDFMKASLDAFVKGHGIAAARRVIHSCGVSHLSELASERWPEVLAKLQAEDGKKPAA
jgi:hypothetical protein